MRKAPPDGPPAIPRHATRRARDGSRRAATQPLREQPSCGTPASWAIPRTRARTAGTAGSGAGASPLRAREVEIAAPAAPAAPTRKSRRLGTSELADLGEVRVEV